MAKHCSSSPRSIVVSTPGIHRTSLPSATRCTTGLPDLLVWFSKYTNSLLHHRHVLHNGTHILLCLWHLVCHPRSR